MRLEPPPVDSEDDNQQSDVEKTVNVVQADTSACAVEKLMNYFSDWNALRRAVAVYLKVKMILLDKCKSAKVQNSKSKSLHLQVEDLELAEQEIIKYHQWKEFPTEMKLLSNSSNNETDERSVPKSSPLYSLDPYVENGLLRVGGRLKHAKLVETVKHPVILPKKSSIAYLLIDHEHRLLGHAGRNHVLSNLRQKFWIIGANSAVRSVIHRCVKCRRLRGHVQEQKMSDLPVCRTNDTAPPFTYTGVDYFGPFIIRQGRKDIKMYGVLFTCMASRAIHLEVAYSLDVHSCIHALRRFVARRGNVKQLHSDNGTNLTAANRELKEALAEMDQNALRTEIRNLGIDWKFNPPTGSHMGGIWERQIRTVRKVLDGLLQEHGHQLDPESFHTLMCEIEAIVNSRPLTSVSGDPDDLDPLTPNHILTGRTQVTMPPPGNFERHDLYVRRRWRRVQYLANLFWTRWKKEYLLIQQQRHKWNKPTRNMCIGDIVLIKDDSLPRNSWQMGRVVELEHGSDGLVRAVKLKTQNSELRRPVQKLILLIP